ncbi:FeoA domain-containing protein [Phycicoccus sp. MAQZ13P-2]|nr:FeoA domain-containing protein [Phycicoccus mangrovi]MBT9273209.1 FeoA domain-containing protein [Phycicoccus mangrovi]
MSRPSSRLDQETGSLGRASWAWSTVRRRLREGGICVGKVVAVVTVRDVASSSAECVHRRPESGLWGHGGPTVGPAQPRRSP